MTDSPAEFTRREHRRLPLSLLGTSLSLSGLVVLVLPWLTAPLASDDRFRYLWLAGASDNSMSSAVALAWTEIPDRLEQGRITPVGFTAQYLGYSLAFRLSQLTGAPIEVMHGLLQLAMTAIAVAAIWCFLRALRVRGHRLRPQTAAIMTCLTGVLMLIGNQTQVVRGGTVTAFPVLLIGATVVAFGSMALCLWMADTKISGARWWVAAAPVLVLVSALITLCYELYYVSLPLVVLALIAHSTSPEKSTQAARQHRQRRLVLALALTAMVLSTLVVVRRIIAAHCPSRGCYDGTTLAVDSDTVVIAARNLLNSTPLFARGWVREYREERAPWFAEPQWFEGLGWVAALAVVAGLACLWLAGRAGTSTFGTAIAPHVKERPALVAVAGLALSLAAGSSLIMALSMGVRSVVVGLGTPYRHTLVTWAALCLALVALLTLLATSARQRVHSWATVGVGVSIVVLTIGIAVWPVMAQATRMQQALPPTSPIISTVHAEVISPRLTDSGAAARCQLLAAMGDPENRTAERLIQGANDSFQALWGEPFCADLPNTD